MIIVDLTFRLFYLDLSQCKNVLICATIYIYFSLVLLVLEHKFHHTRKTLPMCFSPDEWIFFLNDTNPFFVQLFWHSEVDKNKAMACYII